MTTTATRTESRGIVSEIVSEFDGVTGAADGHQPFLASGGEQAAVSLVVVMGVTGAGKTTVGRSLAERLQWAFIDADDLHPPANIEKMTAGLPLSDVDREPWLAALRAELERCVARGQRVVLACSALRASYRDALRPRNAPAHEVLVVQLDASPAVIAARVAGRRGHFMPTSLVASQFASLEAPATGLRLDASLPVPALVARIVTAVGGQDVL